MKKKETNSFLFKYWLIVGKMMWKVGNREITNKFKEKQ